VVDPGLFAELWSSPLSLIALVGLAGIVVWNLIPARFANARLIIQIAFFLAMSALLLARRVVPYEPPADGESTTAAILAGSVKLLWWLHLAWALIGFVRTISSSSASRARRAFCRISSSAWFTPAPPCRSWPSSLPYRSER
jgi:hypothetical protein